MDVDHHMSDAVQSLTLNHSQTKPSNSGVSEKEVGTMKLSCTIPALLRLPFENLQQIITFTTPSDAASLSQTCRQLFQIIYGVDGVFIWKALFLAVWDDPRIRVVIDSSRKGWFSGTPAQWESALAEVPFDWRGECQKRIWAECLFGDPPRAAETTCLDRKTALKTLLNVIRTAQPAALGVSWEVPASKNGKWVQTVLKTADALDYTVWPPVKCAKAALDVHCVPDLEEKDLRSELHTYIGLTEADFSHSEHLGEPEDADSDGDGDAGEAPTSEAAKHKALGQECELSATHIGQLRQELRAAAPRHLINFRTVARSFVYNLSNYTSANRWGPLLRDLNSSTGSHKAYWKHLEFLMMTVLWNLKDDIPLVPSLDGETVEMYRRRTKPRLDLDSLQPYSAPGFDALFKKAIQWERDQEDAKAQSSPLVETQVEPVKEKDEEAPKSGINEWDDWAGIEGRWNRVVCFMDYRDLSRYNWPARRVVGSERNVSVFEEEDFMEATRIINIDLKITEIERDPPPERPLSASAIRLNRPRLYFKGESLSTVPYGGMERSGIRGFVECTDSEDIRWHTVSVFQGEERWVSEGVQIGGVGSARGVIGVWSGVDHDPADPAGPCWLWKVAGKEVLSVVPKRELRSIRSVNINTLFSSISGAITLPAGDGNTTD